MRQTQFGDLPAELQATVFAAAGAPLTTCRAAAAAVADDDEHAARWLLARSEDPSKLLRRACAPGGPALGRPEVLRRLVAAQDPLDVEWYVVRTPLYTWEFGIPAHASKGVWRSGKARAPPERKVAGSTPASLGTVTRFLLAAKSLPISHE